MEKVVLKQSKMMYSSNSIKSIKISSVTLKDFLINSIPFIFQSIIEENKCMNQKQSSCFDIKSQVNINLQDYIHQLLKHTYAEAATVIYALMLIDKLIATQKFFLTQRNMHKTFFTALLISIKLLEDVTFEEEQYIEASGLSAKEIANLEYKFLTLLDYNLMIKTNEFNNYLESCVESCYN